MKGAVVSSAVALDASVELPARDALVARLARQSVAKRFDAYADVEWDRPEHVIDHADPPTKEKPHMRRWFIAGLVIADLFILPSGVLASVDPVSVCQANKLRCVARKTVGLLRCYGHAAFVGSSVNPTCLTAQAQTFDSQFATTEARGGCSTTGDSQAVEGVIDAAMAGIDATLRPSLQASACAGSKLNATGNATYRLVNALAKQRKKAIETKFAKIALAFADDVDNRFAPAEASSTDCQTTGDAAAVAAEVRALASDIVLRLWPASRSGLNFAPPAGFSLNANLFAMTDGRTMDFTNYGTAQIIPAGGADITISRLPLPSGLLSAFIAGRQRGRELISTSSITVAGEAATKVTYRDTYEAGPSFEDVLVYVPHGNALYQFVLTYGTGDPAEASFLNSLGALLASATFES